MLTWKRLVLAALAALAVSGCQTTMLSDDRLASTTAGALGVPENDVTILDRRSDPMNTFYTAKTKDNKVYACTISGGGLLSMGLVNPPTCTPRQAQ